MVENNILYEICLAITTFVKFSLNIGTSRYSYGQYPNVIYFYVLYFYEG